MRVCGKKLDATADYTSHAMLYVTEVTRIWK